MNTLYDILELFEAAFDNEKVVSAIIQVDCSGSTRYAEGMKFGVTWRIEADRLNTIPVDPEQLRMAYAHLGEHLLPPFYKEAKARSEGLGYMGSELENRVLVVMAPVLEAMQFNVELAAEKGWLAPSLDEDLHGKYSLLDADFTVAQAVYWTKLGRPGAWLSTELMSMLVVLEGHAEYLDESSAQTWLGMHTAEARPTAKGILDTVFSPDYEGLRAFQVDYISAVAAWTSWWTMLPPLHMSATPLVLLSHLKNPKAEAMVEGWYLSVAQSKKATSNWLLDKEHLYSRPGSPMSWLTFSSALRTVIHSHTTLVWQDKENQAWMLHQALPNDELDHLLVMQDNRVHDYAIIGRQLDPECSTGTLYTAWLQMQDQKEDPVFDTPGLFEDKSALWLAYRP